MRISPTAADPRSRIARPVSARTTGQATPTSTIPPISQSADAVPRIATDATITTLATWSATRWWSGRSMRCDHSSRAIAAMTPTRIAIPTVPAQTAAARMSASAA